MGAIYRATVSLDHCFAYSKAEMGIYTDGLFDIELDDYTPYVAAPYHMSLADLEFSRNEVDGLKECKVVRDTISPWGFPSIVVHRVVDGTDKRRLVVDFRPLNSRTRNDAFPMPDCDWVLGLLQRANYYSKLDLKSGFWQVGLTDRAKEVCVFLTKEG